MKKVTQFFILLSILLFSGCASYIAQNHLKQKETDKGIAHTTQELKNNPSNASMNYYHARFLYSRKQYAQALKFFENAYKYDSDNAYYKFWLGVSYGKIKEYKKEQDIYLEILEDKGKYKIALIYLGKSYYKSKEYKKALKVFEEAISLYKKHSQMFYYYAKTLNKLNKPEEAKKYFIKYLSYYPSYSLARGATYNLNALGDFTYSNFKIDDKILSIKNINYISGSDELEFYSKQSLNSIGNILLDNKELTLYIVAYEKENLKKAEIRVKNIKKYLLSLFPEINFKQIKIAWLQTSKNIKVGKQRFAQDSYVNFFTTNKKGK